MPEHDAVDELSPPPALCDVVAGALGRARGRLLVICPDDLAPDLAGLAERLDQPADADADDAADEGRDDDEQDDDADDEPDEQDQPDEPDELDDPEQPGSDLPDVVVATPADLVVGLSRPTVLVVARDVAELRRLVSFAARLGRARRVGVLVLGADRAIVPRIHPSWPRVNDLDARCSRGVALTWLAFADRAQADRVLLALGRGAAPRLAAGPAGVRVAMAPDRLPPPVDHTLRTDLGDDLERPVDVVLGLVPGEAVAGDVTGRLPAVLDDTPDLDVGPIDEAVFGPRSFRHTAAGPDVDLDPAAALTPALVAELAEARAVRLTWPCGARLVAGLAMSGLPLVGGPVPDDARARLGDPLADALDTAADVDLADPRARQRLSLRLRRAALLTHSTAAWRGRIAVRADVRPVAAPSVGRLDGRSELVLLGPDPGPQLLADLVLARAYSGADLVGLAAGPGDKRAESYSQPKGRSVLLDRALLRRLGVTDEVPPALVAVLAVRAGAVAYTTHGMPDA